MNEILIGAALFTGIVLSLSVIILSARSQLVSSGLVTITVNADKVLNVPSGSKLLTALSDQALFLPSACGGGGGDSGGGGSASAETATVGIALTDAVADDYDQALADYSRAIELAPSWAEPYASRADGVPAG